MAAHLYKEQLNGEVTVKIELNRMLIADYTARIVNPVENRNKLSLEFRKICSWKKLKLNVMES